MSGCGAERGLISVDEAIELISNRPKKLGSIQQVLQNSLSRYLAKEIYSEINLPSFSQSAVDGYALCSHAEDLNNQKFQVTGEIRAGSESHDILSEGQAIRIFTGGKIPEGTTHVARQEIVSVVSPQEICLTEHIRSQADIRFTGEEIQNGQLLAQVGQFLNIGSLAALSMAGVQTVDVYRAPKVAVLVTGDEVAETAEDLAEGKIFDANGPLLKAWFEDYGLEIELIHVADEAAQVTHYFNQLKNSYDVIITTGGVSVGDYDFVRPCAFETGFEQIFWKVKQKPGKPLFFAEYSHTGKDQRCYLLGLPGNPAAVYVSMQIYGKALLDTLQGNSAEPEWFSAILDHNLKEDARERFLRMHAYFNNGQLKVKSLAKQQSHMLSNLMQANCLVRIPASVKLEAGHILKGVFISN
ncbi:MULTISPECIES: molybdopterin molybdotransferase MoeA [Acinetobacter]|jgi:molybdopterin molybdotransferase|uniref:Molybdopterin molybdenumtransferase n=1 Tax=Acinetobacter pittii TaxID=48296 RepID=A0A242U350_ACIPI|nr:MULTISPECIES: molybdopterin molybdotransferase MoeA [Acinetobacter]EXS24246.1 molybdenum cofactor synthesis domain protein [Acinetobacter baumannii 573719]MBJ8472214.1 molybdopterin molybdotransferase MoeA [Acinetobacter pittii]MBJ8499978.1 molybdopterin molybdotransferase MoeA [Acinetobacter pittii]MBJ9890720.1 molybdopterin molybdotransferase MoeA [Acinetobacter pittii]MCU4477262.1 molybdopterin molybdotransferase MoeA [Acinetobacter sp. WU_MDCI_Abxd143]